ncbi:DUF5691 domain-containing protein [Massilia sp. IC2-477]|uniref:DUF5691 domain-containing protein n=1 Tax=Massilia sp. IC2-477 TaxID=2887198 RepID=UPI001D117E82|nr:DUF5691 domain-containing protein [Massilia sp. IC2-477]MCC2958796.1 DUF5691 domain-containing protein [Massilia sp. IC2-477]
MSDPGKLYGLLQVGTSRAAGVQLPELPAELADLMPPADTSDAGAASRLWLSLGAWSLWARAGLRPTTVDLAAAPAPSGAEQLRTCPAGAESLLARLLQGGQKPVLLREWLRELKRYGGCLPARFLPNLLALATRHAELQADVADVLGERGRWLSRFDPAWSWAAPAVAREDRLTVWETGSAEQRHAALAQWRYEDPDAAREALAQAWASEPPDRRAQLLGCLLVGLGPADEAFLESALDDRRKEVRVAAQAVLVQLPGSALRRRMQARSEPLLQPKRSLLGRSGIEVTLPEALDKAMARDGVGAAAHPGLGEKAGWLVDLLAATDPRVWTARFGASPADLLAMAARSDFAHALVRGWSSAVVRGVAAPGELSGWVHALLLFWMSADAQLRQQYPKDFFDMYARMPAADVHAHLSELVKASPRSWGKRELVLIDLLGQAARRSAGVLPAALSREIVTRLLGALPDMPEAQWELRVALESLAGVVEPQSLAGLEAGWGAGAPEGGINHHIASFFDIVRLRHEMSLSFQEPA